MIYFKGVKLLQSKGLSNLLHITMTIYVERIIMGPRCYGALTSGEDRDYPG